MCQDLCRSYALFGGLTYFMKVKLEKCDVVTTDPTTSMSLDCYGFYASLVGRPETVSPIDPVEQKCCCENQCTCSPPLCWEGRSIGSRETNSACSIVPRIANGPLDVIDGLVNHEERATEIYAMSREVRLDLTFDYKLAYDVSYFIRSPDGRALDLVKTVDDVKLYKILSSDATVDIARSSLDFHLPKTLIMGGTVIVTDGEGENLPNLNVINYKTSVTNLAGHLVFKPRKMKWAYFTFDFNRGPVGHDLDYPQIYVHGSDNELVTPEHVEDCNFPHTGVGPRYITAIKGVEMTEPCEGLGYNVADFCVDEEINPNDYIENFDIEVYSQGCRGGVAIDVSALVAKYGEFPIDVTDSDGKLLNVICEDFEQTRLGSFDFQSGYSKPKKEKKLEGLFFLPTPTDGRYSCVFAIPVMVEEGECEPNWSPRVGCSEEVSCEIPPPLTPTHDPVECEEESEISPRSLPRP